MMMDATLFKLEVRDRAGVTLASGESIEDVVRKLVGIIEKQRDALTAQLAKIDHAICTEPDVSAVAPEHVTGYRSGWQACQRLLYALD